MEGSDEKKQLAILRCKTGCSFAGPEAAVLHDRVHILSQIACSKVYK
jgi:hypothetical protein